MKLSILVDFRKSMNRLKFQEASENQKKLKIKLLSLLTLNLLKNHRFSLNFRKSFVKISMNIVSKERKRILKDFGI